MERIDFLIVAALDIEMNALSREFGCGATAPQPREDGLVSHRVQIELQDATKGSVLIVRLNEMGTLAASAVSSKLIAAHRPWCVVSFGIAGGFIGKGEDVNLLDVVVPDTIIYYEPAKEDRDTATDQQQAERRSRARFYEVSPSLLSICRRYLATCEPARCRTVVVGGPIASGEKKIVDIDAPTRTAILKIRDKTLAVEMEAAGVAAAVEAYPEMRPYPHVLVIKGISDDAGQDAGTPGEPKEAQRQQAADEAARFLRGVLSMMKPEYPRPIAGKQASEVKKMAATLVEQMPAWVSCGNETEIAQMLFPRSEEFPAFYNWRAFHPQVHWVDFVHLLLLRKLQSICPHVKPTLLVIDKTADMQARQSTLAVVDTLFHGTAEVVWYADVEAEKGRFIDYAIKHGLDDAARKTILSTKHVLGVSEGNFPSETWLCYIAWKCESVGKCIVLRWKRHARIYEQLMHILGLRTLFMTTPVLMIGDGLGKFAAPGRDLVIAPPHFAALRKWIETCPTPNQVTDFCTYFDGLLDEGQSQELADTPGRSPQADVGGQTPSAQRDVHDPAMECLISKLQHVLGPEP